MRTDRCLIAASIIGLALLATAIPQDVVAQGNVMSASKRAVIDHWTPERRAAAEPRDLVLDAQGQGYLRRSDGSLKPYGQRATLRADAPIPFPGKPGGGGGDGGDSGDTTAPSIGSMDPDGISIGSAYTFTAEVTDVSGLKSVAFVITYPSGTTQSFSAGSSDGVNWSIDFNGFTDGNWQWHVVAKDNAGKGGNTATSAKVPFSVDTSGGSNSGSNTGGGTGDGYAIVNDAWTGGTVQTAAGRIYFEMPSNQRRKRWNGYVCSGTSITDGNTSDDGTTQDDRSIIITAAHCVYDDANKAFARNVLFIPDQDGTSGSGTDRNCGNDPIGCWVPDFGVVDVNWTTRTFPANIPWDYAYYVVSNSGSHFGPDDDPDNPPDPHLLDPDLDLEVTAGSLPVSFLAPQSDIDPPSTAESIDVDFTHALGYSYSDDPNFMYCAEDLTTESDYGDWWLASCGLSGGSSGGPWVQTMDTTSGSGPIISVNSWGYTGAPGMAGPKLVGTTAECLLQWAEVSAFMANNTSDGDAGYSIDPADCP
jgi:hypothetical protein